jgi:hypothetical protein
MDPRDPMSVLDFFSGDLARALRGLATLERSVGPVTSTDTFHRLPGANDLVARRGGVFTEEVIAHVDVAGIVHPAIYGTLASLLGHAWEEIRGIARGELALRDRSVVRADDPEAEGALTGAAGLAFALRREAVDDPSIALCGLRRIPVPPLDTRPLRPGLGNEPAMVDPSVGPLNESWLDLVDRARRELRLIELGAPPIILRWESACVQRAFEAVLARTMVAKLVPPLAEPTPGGPNDRIALAFVGRDRLLLQRGHAVHVLGIGESGSVQACAPAACALRGVVAGRYAFFEGFFPETHPSFAEDIAFVGERASRDESGFLRLDWEREVSVLDCAAHRYLDVLPAAAPSYLVTHGEPEELFLQPVHEPVGEPPDAGMKRLRIGNDRPEVLAYTNDLRFAWVGEAEDTVVIQCDNGRTAIFPAGRRAFGEVDDDESECLGAFAAAFADGKWWFVWNGRWLTNHLADEPVRLPATGRACAFDDVGEQLAIVTAKEIVVLERKTLRVRARLALPTILTP